MRIAKLPSQINKHSFWIKDPAANAGVDSKVDEDGNKHGEIE
jgi:hypothetical protein